MPAVNKYGVAIVKSGGHKSQARVEARRNHRVCLSAWMWKLHVWTLKFYDFKAKRCVNNDT